MSNWKGIKRAPGFLHAYIDKPGALRVLIVNFTMYIKCPFTCADSQLYHVH